MKPPGPVGSKEKWRIRCGRQNGGYSKQSKKSRMARASRYLLLSMETKE